MAELLNFGLFQVGAITQFGTACGTGGAIIPIAGILDGKRKAAFRAESQAGFEKHSAGCEAFEQFLHDTPYC